MIETGGEISSKGLERQLSIDDRSVITSRSPAQQTPVRSTVSSVMCSVILFLFRGLDANVFQWIILFLALFILGDISALPVQSREICTPCLYKCPPLLSWPTLFRRGGEGRGDVSANDSQPVRASTACRQRGANGHTVHRMLSHGRRDEGPTSRAVTTDNQLWTAKSVCWIS